MTYPEKIRTYPGFLQVIKLKSCDSTNNYLKENYEKIKERFPVLITAARQTKGRGRDKRTWESKKGLGLYSSFGFYLKPDSKLNLLPLAAGISVIETLNQIKGLQDSNDRTKDRAQEFGLKWPNDILYKNRKISGILIENTIFKEEVLCIAGIGINLNHSQADFPGALKESATSLKLITGQPTAVEKVNKVLAHIFFSWLEILKNKEEKKIIEKANRLSAFLLDRRINFHRDNKIITGIFRGINSAGGIILKVPGQGAKIYYSGELNYI